MYRLAAIREIGFPNPDYVLDWGEYEYGYRVTKAGYKGFIHQEATMKHNIRRVQSLSPVTIKLGPFTMTFYDDPPIRCYYLCRNTLYFTLYDSIEGQPSWSQHLAWAFRGVVWRLLPAPHRPGMLRGVVWQVLLFALNFIFRPRNHGRQIIACFRGIWDGVTGNISARY